MSASRVFYASGAGPGGEAAAAGRPRQQHFPPRRSAESDAPRERRPPQQLYVPPRHRQGGASSGFNRASSPGFSTCSEIVTSWRARATPPRCASPGPLSPGAARPPAGPRRRLSHQTSDGGSGAWRQSGESLNQSRPSSRQSTAEPGGSPRKRSGRRRRRSGRRSRSKSEDRPASAAEPVTPPHAPWRRDHRDSWDGGQPRPQRSPSPRGPPRPRFQQVYVPPARRDRESPAPSLGPGPGPGPQPQHRPDLSSPAHQSLGGGRGRGVHTPHRVASPGPGAMYQDYRRSPAPPQQQPASTDASPRRLPIADEPGSTASLGRRGSRRRRRRGRDGTVGGGPTAPSPTPDRRSVSPTDLIASLQLESGSTQPPAPSDRYRTSEPAVGRAPGLSEPQSPTDVMAHLGVRPSPLLPRTDSLGQLVNTTDDEKVTLGGGRGRGRGRPLRQPGPPGPTAPGLPQSDEVKAALRRPDPQSNNRWSEPADTKPGSGPMPSDLIVSSSRPGGNDVTQRSDAPPRCPDAEVRQSPGQRGQRHVDTRPAAPQPAVSQPSPTVAMPNALPAAAVVVPGPAVAPPAPAVEERQGTAAQFTADRSGPAAANSSPAPQPTAAVSATPAAPEPEISSASAAAETLVAAAEPAVEVAPSSASPASERAGSSDPPDRAVSASVAVPERSRRHSSASFSGLFNLSLDEPFNWADEMDEWEKRFNDEGDATDAANAEVKTPRSPAKKRQSGGGGGRSGRSRQPDPDDEPASDPSLPAHIIELYNFPSGFSKQDFNVVFADFVGRGFDVRPVDDRHALGVFSNAACATEALRLCHPMLLSRPLSQATVRSRQRAAQPANAQLPHRARPETSALHAGRMVATALGVHTPNDGRARQRRDQERRKLRDAKDKKRLAGKQRDDAWEGRF